MRAQSEKSRVAAAQKWGPRAPLTSLRVWWDMDDFEWRALLYLGALLWLMTDALASTAATRSDENLFRLELMIDGNWMMGHHRYAAMLVFISTSWTITARGRWLGKASIFACKKFAFRKKSVIYCSLAAATVTKCIKLIIISKRRRTVSIRRCGVPSRRKLQSSEAGIMMNDAVTARPSIISARDCRCQEKVTPAG